MRVLSTLLTPSIVGLLVSACGDRGTTSGFAGSENSSGGMVRVGGGGSEEGGGTNNGSGAFGSGATAVGGDGAGAANMLGGGGNPSGGAAAEGGGESSSGGDAMGGAENHNGGGGSDNGKGAGGSSTMEDTEFVLCFPWAFADPQEGPLLAATPTGSVLLVGSSGPAELFPEEFGFPFLAEYSPSGTPLQRMTFADAAGPQVITVSKDGEIFLAGQPRSDTRFGDIALPDSEDGAYYLVKLSDQFDVLAAKMVESPATQVNAMHVDANGDLIVGTAVSDFEEGSMHPVVTKFSGNTLQEQWSTESEHEIMPALSTSIVTLPDGRIVASGHYSRELSIGEFLLSKPVEVLDDRFLYNGWVAWLSPEEGTPVAAESWGGAVNNGVLGSVVTSTGGLRLLGAPSSGNLTVFDQELNEGTDPIGVLVDLDAARSSRQVVPFDRYAISAMALGIDDETYVVGGYGSSTDDVSSRGSEVRRIESDGRMGPTIRLSTGHHAKQVAVDAQGGIWISAGWETPFEWNGATHVPPLMGSGDGERCRLVMRMNGVRGVDQLVRSPSSRSRGSLSTLFRSNTTTTGTALRAESNRKGGNRLSAHSYGRAAASLE